ncbi:DoxX family protein [Actinoplanes sp. CA-252034]|uniref:DoxX family protein n=1 Tax=Actinoplanes sp. CA-252034 TaxID=3239906 RepID=UPI003D95A1CC
MPLVRAIGGPELAGAAGLILPPLTGIAPWLAPAAAVGLGLAQVGRIIVHVTRGEVRVIATGRERRPPLVVTAGRGR